MPELLRFGTHTFSVDSNVIKSFKELKFKTSVTTEDVEENGNKYVKLKNKGTTQVDFTAVFADGFGNDVQAECLLLQNAAQNGETDYLYIAGAGRLWPYKLMITEAETAETVIGPGGLWVSATVHVTMKQAEPSAGTTEEKKSSSSEYSTYKVQIPGMSELKVKARGVQEAVSKAAGAKYTGVIFVNSKSYNFVDGKPSTAEDLAKVQKEQADKKKAEKAQKELADTIKKGKEFVTNLINKWTTPAKEQTKTPTVTTKTTNKTGKSFI